MFLSRLVLDPRSREVRRDLADCHQMHRTLLGGFGAATKEHGGARAELGVLYRIDVVDSSTLAYVQSRDQPDWSLLPHGYLVESTRLPGGNPAVRTLDSAYETLAPGRVLRFRLLANPTRKVHVPRPDGTLPRNGSRVPLRGDQAHLAWLHRKASEGGFSVERVSSEASPEAIRSAGGRRIRGRKFSDAGNHLVQLEGVLFDGHLRVTDRDAFLLTLERGIGSGKAYGFGLLSLAPA